MTKKLGKVLLVDDNEDILIAGKLLLKQHCEQVDTEKDPNLLPTLIRDENYDVILLDMNFTQDVTSGREGFFWLERILEIDPMAVVILITAFGDVEMAVRAIKAGATDFVLKPWQNEKLLATLSSAISLRRSRLEIDRLKSRQMQLSADIDQKFHDIIGVSPEMRALFSAIDKVAKTEANVLILGENGTGKELVARALHRSSKRSDEVFIGLDMGAIPEGLFESELFGHEKGAFTDAKTARAGRFEVASGGTLFLDEVGNIPVPLQSKLLRVLEERKLFRVGSSKAVEIDIRLICATNMNLSGMVSGNEFRQDLLYRINTVEITLPPLRNRREDIPLLVEHFVKIYSRKYKKDIEVVSPGAMSKLVGYSWPGNVRELQHAMERAVILSESCVLEPIDFLLSLKDETPDRAIFPDLNLERVEKMVLRRALSKHRGNITRAAEELGLTRTSLYRRMEKYGL